MLMKLLYKWANSTPSKGKAAYIIELKGKFWNGYKFVAKRDDAQTFKSNDKAWEYVDDHFGERAIEEISIHKQVGGSYEYDH